MELFFGCLGIIFIWVLGAALSWSVTAGITYLIALCFNLSWSWLIATGIWLVLILIRGTFKVVVHKE